MNIKQLSLIVIALSLQVPSAYGMEKIRQKVKGLRIGKKAADESTIDKVLSKPLTLILGEDRADRPNPNSVLKFLPTADALMKLYFFYYADDYSEVASGTVKQEAQTALANLGQNSGNYEIKLISTPCFNNIFSFKKEVNGKTVLYLDKVGLAGKNQEQIRAAVQDKVEAALYRHFITYETIKAVIPFIVHISGNAVIDSAWGKKYKTGGADFNIQSTLLDSSAFQLLISTAIISAINYSKAYKLPYYISQKVR